MTVDVAIRLGLQGGKEAGSELDVLGLKGQRALSRITDEAKGVPHALRAVSQGVEGLKTTVGNLAASFGPYASIVATGLAAMAGAAGSMLIAARQAAEFGAEIASAATKAGVSTDRLQEMRYAIAEVGGEAKDADQSLADFNKKLGDAQAGGGSLKAFEQLGFTQGELKSFKDGGEALDAVADRVAKLKRESAQATIADKLGLTPLLPLLRQGSAGMAELREAARDLGYVMDEDLVKQSDEAATKVKALEQVVRVQMNSALVEAAPLLTAVADGIATGAREARGFFDEIKDGMPILQQWLDKLSWLSKFNDWLKGNSVVGQGVSAASDLVDFLARRGRRDQVTSMLSTLPQGVKDLAAGKKIDLAGTEWAGADKRMALPEGTVELGDAKAEQDAAKRAREAEKAARVRDATQKQIDAAYARVLSAQQAVATSIEERRDLEVAAIGVALKAREADIKRDAAEGRIDATLAKELLAREQKAAMAEETAVIDKARKEIAERDLQDAEQLGRYSVDLLQIASSQAKTAEERRRIELRILEITQRQEAAALDAELAERGDLSAEQKRQRRSQLAAYHKGQRQEVDFSTAGPLQEYSRSLIRTNADIRESLQGIAVDGFQALNQGMVDAIANGRDLGETFANLGNQIVASMASMVIQAKILAPLMDAILGGQGQSGGGGWGDLINLGVSMIFGGNGAGSSPTLGGGSHGASNYKLSLGRESGGPTYRGDLRPMFERGFERIGYSSADGYVFDASRSAREMADAQAAASAGYAGGAGGPLSVNLIDRTGHQVQAAARERFDEAGGRVLDIDLFKAVDKRVAKGNRDLFNGGYDRQFHDAFGVRRRLTGG